MLKYEKFGVGGWLSLCTAQQERLLRLKRYAVLYISFAHLLRSNWTLLEGYMHSLSTQQEDEPFNSLYSLLWGMYFQTRGALDKAAEWYSKIHFTNESLEVYLLTLLNRTLLPDENREKILEHVEQRLFRLGMETVPHLWTAYFLIKGIFTPELLKSGYYSIASMC